MSDEDVQVRFGAQIEGLVAGVESVKESISSIAGPVNSIISSFGEMKEALIAAFAIDKAAEFVDRITEIGEQILRGTQMTGLSATEYQTLAYAMKVTGSEAGNLGIVVDRLERNIALARGGSGQAVQAFQTLGVSMDDLKNKSPYQIIQQISDGFHNLKDPILAAAAATEVGSRGFAQMLPALKAGSEGLEEFGERFRKTGAYMNDVQASAMAATHESLIELQTAIEGTGVQLIRALKPAIDLVVTALTELIEWLNEVLSGLADLVTILEGSILLGFAKCIEMVEEFGVEANLVVEKLEASWQALGRIITDVSHGSIEQATKEWTVAQEEMDVANKRAEASLQSYGRQYEELRTKIAQATGALTNFWSALGEKKGAGGGGGALATGQGNDDATQMALDQIKTEEQLAKIGLQTQKDYLEQEVAAQKISKAQEFETLQEYVQLEYQVESEALNKKLALYDDDEVKYQEVLNQKKILDAQYEQELARLSAQGAQAQEEADRKNEQQFKAMTDLVSRDLDQMLTGILSGTQTWEQAMAKLFSNIAVSFVEAVLKMMVQWAAFEALTGFGVGGLVNPLGGGLGGLAAGALGIKSYDVGSWSVPNDQLAFIHAGEMIVPAQQANAIRSGSGVGSGGGNYTININAIDTQTGASFLKQNAAVIAQTLAGQSRNFNSSLSGAWKS